MLNLHRDKKIAVENLGEMGRSFLAIGRIAVLQQVGLVTQQARYKHKNIFFLENKKDSARARSFAAFYNEQCTIPPQVSSAVTL